MTQLPNRKQREFFQKEQKRLRVRIKRAVLKLVRAKPDMMGVGNLSYNLCRQSKEFTSTNETMVADTILSMIDCGMLALSSDEYLILGPRAPKLRKK